MFIYSRHYLLSETNPWHCPYQKDGQLGFFFLWTQNSRFLCIFSFLNLFSLHPIHKCFACFKLHHFSTFIFRFGYTHGFLFDVQAIATKCKLMLPSLLLHYLNHSLFKMSGAKNSYHLNCHKLIATLLQKTLT